MTQIHDLHTDMLAAEVEYRRSVLLGTPRHIADRPNWWQRRKGRPLRH